MQLVARFAGDALSKMIACASQHCKKYCARSCRSKTDSATSAADAITAYLADGAASFSTSRLQLAEHGFANNYATQDSTTIGQHRGDNDVHDDTVPNDINCGIMPYAVRGGSTPPTT